MNINLSIKAVCIVLTISFFTPDSYGQSNTPGKEWGESSKKDIESLGFKMDSLSKAWRYIRDETPATGMMVIINGKSTIYFGDIEEVSYVASVRKSLLAMLYGIYLTKGEIDISQTLEKVGIDDIGGLSTLEKSATIEHLLTAKSGVYHAASNTGDDTRFAPDRNSQQPGTYFLYNNWDFNAAGTAFEKLTGTTIYKAFEQSLAIPLEMQDFDLSKQKKSGDSTLSEHLAYHFYLSTRDMARLGLLMLNQGKWGDTQILSAEMVKKLTTPITLNSQMNPEFRKRGPLGYGYLWWVFEGNRVPKGFEGAYLAQGNFGQFIAVLPAMDMVVALKTKDIYGRSTMPLAFFSFLKILVSSKN